MPCVALLYWRAACKRGDQRRIKARTTFRVKFLKLIVFFCHPVLTLRGLGQVWHTPPRPDALCPVQLPTRQWLILVQRPQAGKVT